ncbi:MAG: hypothetical protein ACREQB_06900 [Candidatus Binataceae bacterium]
MDTVISNWTARALMVVAMVMAGCALATDEAAEIQARNQAEQAALSTIVVTKGSEVNGRATYTRLGRVQGFCDRDIERQDHAVGGDSLRQAAYRRYGEQVKAIVETNAWFILDGAASTVWATEGGGGHFECAGIAVTFEQG